LKILFDAEEEEEKEDEVLNQNFVSFMIVVFGE